MTWFLICVILLVIFLIIAQISKKFVTRSIELIQKQYRSRSACQSNLIESTS